MSTSPIVPIEPGSKIVKSLDTLASGIKDFFTGAKDGVVGTAKSGAGAVGGIAGVADTMVAAPLRWSGKLLSKLGQYPKTSALVAGLGIFAAVDKLMDYRAEKKEQAAEKENAAAVAQASVAAPVQEAPAIEDNGQTNFAAQVRARQQAAAQAVQR